MIWWPLQVEPVQPWNALKDPEVAAVARSIAYPQERDYPLWIIQTVNKIVPLGRTKAIDLLNLLGSTYAPKTLPDKCLVDVESILFEPMTVAPVKVSTMYGDIDTKFFPRFPNLVEGDVPLDMAPLMQPLEQFLRHREFNITDHSHGPMITKPLLPPDDPFTVVPGLQNLLTQLGPQAQWRYEARFGRPFPVNQLCALTSHAVQYHQGQDPHAEFLRAKAHWDPVKNDYVAAASTGK